MNVILFDVQYIHIKGISNQTFRLNKFRSLPHPIYRAPLLTLFYSLFLHSLELHSNCDLLLRFSFWRKRVLVILCNKNKNHHIGNRSKFHSSWTNERYVYWMQFWCFLCYGSCTHPHICTRTHLLRLCFFYQKNVQWIWFYNRIRFGKYSNVANTFFPELGDPPKKVCIPSIVQFVSFRTKQQQQQKNREPAKYAASLFCRWHNPFNTFHSIDGTRCWTAIYMDWKDSDWVLATHTHKIT